MKCIRCAIEFSDNEVIKTESGKHIKASCPKCGNYIKFIQQTEPSGDDVMPFGKYKGKTASWITESDPEYALWGAENLKGRYQKAFKKCLKI